MKTLLRGIVLLSVVFVGSALADEEITHPNLKDAYQKINEAIHHVREAQQNNQGHGVFGGHAVRAEQLLQQAKHEIEESDEFRNKHMHDH